MKTHQNNPYFASLLRDDEEILFIIHKHWGALVIPLSKTLFFGVVIPLVLYWLFIESQWSLFLIPWIMVGTILVIRCFLDWYYDVLLLTSESIVDVDWKGFFHRTSTRIDYDTIEGVEHKSRGLLSTIFKFGDITLQLRSGDSLTLPFTARAQDMQERIMEKRDAAEEGDGPDADVETLKRAIKSLLGDEMVKRKHGIPVEERSEEEDEEANIEEEDEEEFEDDEDVDHNSEPLVDEATQPEEHDVIVMETRSIRPSHKEKTKSHGFTAKKVGEQKSKPAVSKKPRKKSEKPKSSQKTEK